jgi:hypothetical protein
MTALNIRSLKKKTQRKSDLESRSEKSEALSKVGAAARNRHSETKKQLVQKPQVKSQPFVPGDQPVTEQSQVFFQAVGVIRGQVHFYSDNRATIMMAGKEYPLLYVPRFKDLFDSLKQRIDTTGEPTQRLAVYPTVIHVAENDQPYKIRFFLINFDQGDQHKKQGILTTLEDMEFNLCGLWKFVPICSLPCISVYKNATPKRVQQIQNMDLIRRVNALKPSHIPVIWDNPPIEPFQSSVEEKEEETPSFVQVKARFLPTERIFKVVSAIAPPNEQPPEFLKASKEEKRLAQEAKQAQKNQSNTRPLA